MSYPVISDNVVQKIRNLEREVNAVQEYTDADLGDNIIYNYHITTGAVTSDSIANATITGGDIASATIVAANIANATITATQIANATITGTQIASATITGTHIQDASITGADIGSGVITGTNIGTATITSTHIQDATIQGADIASATIAAGNIVSGTITATQIANATITATQIANATITGTQIATGTITGTNILDATIQAADIANATITATQIANATITSVQIANATITASQIQDNTITAAKITDLTITSSEIADLTITGAKIAAATLTADKITVTNLSALSANLGTITAGSITGVTITGVTFQTSATNPRVFMDPTGIGAIQANGQPSFKLDASTGKISTLAGIGGFNLIPNASFEDPINPLTGYEAITNNSIEAVTFPVVHGDKAIKVTRVNGTGSIQWGTKGSNTLERIRILPTTDYTFSMYMMPTLQDQPITVESHLIDEYTGSFLTYKAFVPTTAPQPINQWNRIIGSYNSPSLYATTLPNYMDNGSLRAYWRMGDPTQYNEIYRGVGDRMYYRLNDVSGTTVVDSSANTNPGTYVGSPTFQVTGALANSTDKAVQFNGTNAGFTTANTYSADNITQTVSFWLWWDAYANDNKTAIKRGTGSAGSFSVTPNFSNGTFAVAFTGDVGNNSVNFTRPSAATWHHYEITMDASASLGQELKVYVDGVVPPGFTGPVSNNNTTLGGTGAGSTYFMHDNAGGFAAGRMDEVFFSWTGVETLAQIRDRYRQGKGYIRSESTDKHWLQPSIQWDATSILTYNQPGLIAVDTDKSVRMGGLTNHRGAEAPTLDTNTLMPLFQISGWAYLNTNTGQYGLFSGSGNNVTHSLARLVYKPQSNGVNFTPSETGSNTVNWNIVLPFKEKFHWAFTWNNSTRAATLYINGISQGTLTPTGAWHASAGFLRVGYAWEGSSHWAWDGWMDEITVNNDIWGIERFQALYKWGTDPAIRAQIYSYNAGGSALQGEYIYYDALQLEQGTIATAFAPKSDEYLPNVIGSTQIQPNSVSGSAGGANIVDTFDGPSINGMWTVTDYAGADQTTSIVDGRLRITGASSSDFYGTSDTGVYVSQACTSNTTFEVDVVTLPTQYGRMGMFRASNVNNAAFVGVTSADSTNTNLQLVWRDTTSASAALGTTYAMPTRPFKLRMTLGSDSKTVSVWINSGGILTGIGSHTTTDALTRMGLAGSSSGTTGNTEYDNFRTLNETHIVGQSIMADDIKANTITAGQIAANTITASQIAANTITATQIAANTITAAQIAAETITANEIQSGSITSTKINVTDLSALSANLGTITTGTLTGVTITGATVQTAEIGQRVVLDASGLTAYGAAGEAVLLLPTSGDSMFKGAVDAEGGVQFTAPVSSPPPQGRKAVWIDANEAEVASVFGVTNTYPGSASQSLIVSATGPMSYTTLVKNHANIKHYWKLNGGTSPTLDSVTTSPLQLTSDESIAQAGASTPQVATGLIAGTDSAIKNDAAGVGYFTGAGAAENVTTGLTIEYWLRMGQRPNYDVRLMQRSSAYNGTTAEYWKSTYKGATGKLEVSVLIGAVARTQLTTTVLAANTTYHVVHTYDGANIRTYLNAVANGTATAQTGSIDAQGTVPYRVGVISTGDNTSSRFPNAHGDVAGDGVAGWASSGPTIYTDNNAGRFAQVPNNSNSHYLTSGSHGFSIPADATIVGIEVTVKAAVGHTTGHNTQEVGHTKAYTTLSSKSNNIVSGDTLWTTIAAAGGMQVKTYGGPTDLGGTTYTPAEINSSNFGAYFKSRYTGGAIDSPIEVDYIKIKVYYTTSITVDEAAVYDAAITQAVISDHYQTGTTGISTSVAPVEKKVISADGTSDFALSTGAVVNGFEATYGSGSVAGTGASTWWWVSMNSKSADSSSWFNTTTGRYTPQEPGWYQLNVSLQADSGMTFGPNVTWYAGIYKNGAHYKQGEAQLPGNVVIPTSSISVIVWANGTTDYFMPDFWHNDSVGHGVSPTATVTHFSGSKLGR